MSPLNSVWEYPPAGGSTDPSLHDGSKIRGERVRNSASKKMSPPLVSEPSSDLSTTSHSMDGVVRYVHDERHHLYKLTCTRDMCFEVMTYLGTQDLFSVMLSCRQFHDLIHANTVLLRPFALNGIRKCLSRLEKYEVPCLALLDHFGENFSQEVFFGVLVQAMNTASVNVLYTVLDRMEVTSTVLRQALLECNQRSHPIYRALMNHPKVEGLVPEVVSLLIHNTDFYELERLPLDSIDLSIYFNELLEDHPTFFSSHSSLLHHHWQRRKDRHLIVERFARIFSGIRIGVECKVVLDYLELMNTKERAMQKQFVIEQSEELKLELLLRQSLFKTFGLDILKYSLTHHHHNVVLRCLTLDPLNMSQELDMQHLTLELIVHRQYFWLAQLIQLFKTSAIEWIATSPRNYLRLVFEQAVPLGSNSNYFGVFDTQIQERTKRQESSLNCLIITVANLFPEIDYTRNENELLRKAALLKSDMITTTLKKLQEEQLKKLTNEQNRDTSNLEDCIDDDFQKYEVLLHEINNTRINDARF